MTDQKNKYELTTDVARIEARDHRGMGWGGAFLLGMLPWVRAEIGLGEQERLHKEGQDR